MPFGVERALDLAEGVVEPRPVERLVEGAAGPAVPVLAGEPAAELHDERGDLLGDGAHLPDLARVLQVDERPDVEAPDRAVPVVAGRRAVAVEDLAEARDERAELGRLDRGVLDERDGLPVALGPEEEPEPRLAKLPDRLLLRRVVGDVRGVADALPGPERLERLDLGPHLRLGLAGVLDDHDGGRVALDESHARPLLDVLAGQVEDHLVGDLDRVRPRRQEVHRRFERRLEVVVVDHVERRELRAPAPAAPSSRPRRRACPRSRPPGGEGRRAGASRTRPGCSRRRGA